jgi:hypothetical protein
MFTKFAEKYGSHITLGTASWSQWGPYVDWKVSLRKDFDIAVPLKRLVIVDNFYCSFPFNYSFQRPVSQERKGVIDRARLRQKLRLI